jgi:amino acid permease
MFFLQLLHNLVGSLIGLDEAPLLAIVAFGVMLPMCLVRDIEALGKVTSPMGVTSLGLLLMIVVYKFLAGKDMVRVNKSSTPNKEFSKKKVSSTPLRKE